MESPGALQGSVLRREDPALISGNGSFVADLVPDNALHCVFIRSPIAHGVIRSISLERCREVPGVFAALDASDLALKDLPSPPLETEVLRPILANNRVRYVGEPLAVILSDDPKIALDASELAEFDIEPLPVASPFGEHHSEGATLFPAMGDNIVSVETTEHGAGLPKDTDVEVRLVINLPPIAPSPIEPLAVLAEPTENGLDLWVGSQSPNRLHDSLCSFLGLSPGRLRVRVPDVGGGFGLKGGLYPEYAVVVASSLRFDRAVTWLASQREQFLMGGSGRFQRQIVTIVGDRDGKLKSLDVQIEADLGAYPDRGWFLPANTARMVAGPYKVPLVSTSTRVTLSNRPPTCPFRGAGRPEAAYAAERAIDAYARKIGRDPHSVRLANLLVDEGDGVTSSTGIEYDGGDYAAVLRQVILLGDFEGFRHQQTVAERQPQLRLGIGMAFFVDRTAGAPPGLAEYARVSLSDAGAQVFSGSTSTGQSHATVWTGVAASVLTLPSGQIEYIAGDTDRVPYGVGTFGSRSAQVGASAVWRAAKSVVEQARSLAGDMLEASPDDLRLSGGVFAVAGSPDQELALMDIAVEAELRGISLTSTDWETPSYPTYPYGAHVAVVEVDVETGNVSLQRYVAVDDCGRILNEMIVKGQMHGSIAQGIGQALFEELVYDELGQPLTTSLAGYDLPRAADVPSILTASFVTPTPTNPLGVKGVGEAGCLGAPPAIVNAVIDALAPLGVTHVNVPLRPSVVWQAIREAERN